MTQNLKTRKSPPNPFGTMILKQPELLNKQEEVPVIKKATRIKRTTKVRKVVQAPIINENFDYDVKPWE